MARLFLTAIDLARNELQNARMQNLASAPGTTVEGLLYWDTVTKTLEVYNGTGWVSLGRLDQVEAPAADVALAGFKLTGLGTPTNPGDATTKSYVDGLVSGSGSIFDYKDSVRAATTANITLSGGQTIDGVSITTERVLVKNQTATEDNGLYDAGAGAWTRTTDADIDAEVTAGAKVWVSEGTTQANTGWVITTPDPITLGVTGLTWAQFAAAPLPTGAVNKYAQDIGNGALTTIDVAHNLGSRDVAVAVARATTPWDEVYPEVQRLDTNTVRLIFAVAPTTNEHRVTVLA